MIIRSAAPIDTQAMLAIYAPYVRDTAISFETEVPSLAEFSERVSSTQKNFPWLVCEVSGDVVGYAYAGAHRTRCAYSWSVESTVYVKEGAHRRGIGKALYQELIANLQKMGAINILAIIAQPNNASVALHESLGFKPVGIFKDMGFKLERWWDTGYWQLQLPKPERPESLRKPG